ncbi:MAG: hypothetical protein KBC26_02705 [Candidatus Pacebacteria bacterium]|nr:hypothetical protein [Candidatus Paceibacterota bacterium]
MDKNSVIRLLEPIGAIKIQSPANFIAIRHFRLYESEHEPVLIGWIGPHFTEHFLPKVEEMSEDHNLSIFTLTRASCDAPIVSELGGEDGIETTLFKINKFLVSQGRGQGGILLTNGHFNIFYVRDIYGELCSVFLYWGGDFWGIESRSLSCLLSYDADSQVFSRNPR